MRRLTGKESGNAGRWKLEAAARSALLGLFLIPVAAQASWAGGTCTIEPTRIQSWAHAPKLDRPVPFGAEYRGCGKTLIYIAAAHTNDPRSATHRLIQSVFAAERPEVVVVEGVEARAGINPGGGHPRGLLETARRAAGSKADSEALLATRLAGASGAAVMGGEPSDIEVLEAVRAREFDTEDLFAFYVLRFIQQWQRQGKISGSDDPALDDEIRRYAPSFARRVQVDLDELSSVSSLQGFKAWYRSTNRMPYERGYRLEDAAPSSAAVPIRTTNLISDLVGDARERSIVSVIARAVAEYDSVVVVYGASHHPVDAPAIEAAFGRPRLIERR